MRKKRLRGGQHTGGHGGAHGLNINSLLDVLSVILVFLMKSYSSSSVQVKPSADLQMPISHSIQAVQESTAVTITLKDLMVNDQPVVAMQKGHIPDLEHATHGGLMIDSLLDRLHREVERQKKMARMNKKADFSGVMTIIADRHVPFELLTQVMYTAGQAKFNRFKFAAIKSER